MPCVLSTLSRGALLGASLTCFASAAARLQSYNHRWPHPFTTTWGDLSGPSHYYGVSYGPIHVVSLNHYIPFGAGTPQARLEGSAPLKPSKSPLSTGQSGVVILVANVAISALIPSHSRPSPA